MKSSGLSLKNFISSNLTAGDTVENLASKMRNYSDTSEKNVGISKSFINSMDDSLFAYQAISQQLEGYSKQTIVDILNKEKLTFQEQNLKDLILQRFLITQDLASVYPDLLNADSLFIGLSKEKINTMIAENKANSALLDASKLAREGKLNEEQKMTLDAAIETNKRIAIINQEIDALQLKRNKYADNINENPHDSDTLRSEKIDSQLYDKISIKKAELIDLTKLK
ncbi:hypothetical protein [Lysinibacillus pakistanensis]